MQLRWFAESLYLGARQHHLSVTEDVHKSWQMTYLGCPQGYWFMYNKRFYSRVQQYNTNLDGLLEKEINQHAGVDSQVVAATQLQM